MEQIAQGVAQPVEGNSKKQTGKNSENKSVAPRVEKEPSKRRHGTAPPANL